MKIAHQIHNVYGAGVIEALGDAAAEMPREKVDPASVQWAGFDPASMDFNFLGKDLMTSMATQWGRMYDGFRQALFCYNWVMDNRPDAIVLWNDEYAHSRGAITAARDLGIPTVELVHGNIHQKKLGHWAGVKHCDWVVGASWEFKDWYTHYYPDRADRVITTGTVTQDPYAGADLRDDVRAAARQELQLPVGMPIVTFLTDAVFKRGAWQDPGLRYQCMLDFFHAFRMLRSVIPAMHLCIKIHPYEMMRGHNVTTVEYEEALTAAGITENYTIIDEPLISAIAPADLVVGIPSSAMATGYHFGIPALILGYEPFYETEKHAGRGALVAHNEDEILPRMAEILLNEETMHGLIQETTKGVDYFSGTRDGLAAIRVTKALRAIAEAKEIPEECHVPREGPAGLRIQREEGLLERGQPPLGGGGPGSGPQRPPLALG